MLCLYASEKCSKMHGVQVVHHFVHLIRVNVKSQ